MSDVTTQHAGPVVRASDAEREQTVVLLQRNFADGRLTQAELEERASAAYAARTRAQLRDLTADLPAAEERPPRPGRVMDRRLLCILLCVHPPAALVYWLLSLRRTGHSRPQAAQRPSAERTDLRTTIRTTKATSSRPESVPTDGIQHCGS